MSVGIITTRHEYICFSYDLKNNLIVHFELTFTFQHTILETENVYKARAKPHRCGTHRIYHIIKYFFFFC